jgi:chaperonin GroEL (HSP60 family)
MPDSQSLIVYAGGGVALLYASKELDKLQTANFDQKIGVQIIQNALKVWGKKVGINFFFQTLPVW